MPTRKSANILIITTIALTLLIVSTGSKESKNLTCPTASCEAVQESSFGNVFGMPLGAYAAALLSLALLLRLMGKEKAGALILWAMLGAETYMTFIAFTYIETVCFICMIFLVALACCVAVASPAVKLTAGALSAALMFFGAHFVFFYPNAHLKPTLINDATPPIRVELFASPTCTHCEQALLSLRETCTHGNMSLIVRPVSLGDKSLAIEWVVKQLFANPSGTSRRMAERVVRENERQARNLAGGKLAVPIIRIQQQGEERVFVGWNDQVKQHLVSSMGGLSLVRAEIERSNQDTCNKDLNCSETLPFWAGAGRQSQEIN